jgi:pimeloyl-ACP methyl ester carboxylesterase
MRPSSHVVPLNGLVHHYLRWGDEDAPAVLLLHGLRSYAQTWATVAEALSRTHHVIAPDFRGRGGSSWDPDQNYYTTAYVSDVEELVAKLGLRRFSIVGHSMGGAVGYTYAAWHPGEVEALVVEDIGPDSSTSSAGAARIIKEINETPDDFASLDAVHDYWRMIRPDITEEALASRVEHTVRRSSSGRWEWRLDMAGIAKARLGADPAGPVDLWACVELLRCPTLVLRGARSDFLTSGTCERMAARQPRLTWTEVPDAGHYVHDDQPDVTTSLMTDFLTRARL